jgi:hypothetical protein
MSTTLPADATKANCDASTDDPKQALLTDLAGVVDMVNALKAALGTLALLDTGGGVEIETVAGAGNNDLLRLKFATSSKTGAYTAVAGDRSKLLDCSGTWPLGLTAAATLGDGWHVFYRNTGSGTITIDPNSTELVDGAATLAVAPGDSGILICNGTAFFSVGKSMAFASQADMEAATSSAVIVTPSGVKHNPGVAKAFGRFNGTGTPAFDISSGVSATITDGGPGVYTITLNPAMSSANYAVIPGGNYFACVTTVLTASTFRLETYNSSVVAADFSQISFSVFGDQ